MLEKKRGILVSLMGLVLAAGAVGCDDDDDMTNPDPETGTLVIEFDHMVDGTPMTMPGSYTNAAGNSYTVTKLEYIISHIELESEGMLRDSEGYEAEGVIHYRNHADDATRSLTLDDVPVGDYSHLHFVFGLPGSENVAGALPELDALNLAWPPPAGGGYHYMRHEGTYVDDMSMTANFLTHTGPSMGGDYSLEYELDLDTGALRHGFDIEAGTTTTVRLYMNVNEWYQTPNTYDFNDYGPIMMNPAAQQLLMENGAEVWSVADVSTE